MGQSRLDCDSNVTFFSTKKIFDLVPPLAQDSLGELRVSRGRGAKTSVLP